MTKKIKILIVDDYRENIIALSELIASDEVEIFSSMNGNDALELVSRHDFGLALLDVQMPEIDGFELAKLIRSVRRFRGLPIIFVTAHQQDNAFVFKGYKTGAVDLLFKPLNADMVRAKVQVFVELAQQKAMLREHLEELERLRFEAHSANLAKGQFLANMSHEIRTPLSAVMGFADLATREQTTPAEKKECADAVKRNGALLMRLIDDILDLSKIEANKLELELDVFDLTELLRDIAATMSFRAEANGVTLTFNVAPHPQSRFISDPVRIKQVLLNIIGNAIKFSPGGKVVVDVEVIEGARNAQHKLLVTVSDNGIGLTPEETERLFRPFSQADASTKRRFGGSGLGLVISRQIAKATGGDLTLVSSAPKAGTIFRVELMLSPSFAIPEPLQPAHEHESTSTRGPSLKGMKILAVDDSPDNLMLIELYLKDTGVDVTYVENGMQAIAAVKSQDFDLILMDIQMPGMDGYETTEEIRRQGHQGTIIALTAHVLREEHEKCRMSGCNGVMTKPLSQSKLLEQLNAVNDQLH